MVGRAGRDGALPTERFWVERPYGATAMGLHDTVVVADGVDLPKFPEDRSPKAVDWQTKDLYAAFQRTFRLTNDGRLLRQETEMREKTAAEKRAEAAEQGFDSWDAYVAFCADAERQELLRREIGVFGPCEETAAETRWVDHEMHGSLDFHGSKADIEGGFRWSYEARFTNGRLDAIVFLGEDREFRPDEPDIVRFRAGTDA
jgi:hypothetical protein